MAVEIREALSWIQSQQLEQVQVLLESDSLLAVQAIKSDGINLLEVGEVIEVWRRLVTVMNTSLYFVRKMANRVADELAKIPCLANYHNLFTSYPTCVC